MNIRRFAFDGTGSAGPWIVLNPSPLVTGVHINRMTILGSGDDVVWIVFYRSTIVSTFVQRLAIAKRLFFNRDDVRIVLEREHVFQGRTDFIDLNFSVAAEVGGGQALFMAVIGPATEFVIELFGHYVRRD